MSMSHRSRFVALLALGLCLFSFVAQGHGAATEKSPDVTTPPKFDQFFIIPLRIHILKSASNKDIDCQLTDADVERVIGKVNRIIWSNGGVHFVVAEIIREEAANADTFVKDRGDQPSADRDLRPADSRKFDGLHVYYIHEWPSNGTYMGKDYVFAKETASLHQVSGGIDEPLPRVTTHELGHALGLPHRQNMTNLMASGTTGTLLNEVEIATARAKAPKIKGAMTTDQCRAAAKQANKQKDAATAKRFWSALAEIPGAPADVHEHGDPRAAGR